MYLIAFESKDKANLENECESSSEKPEAAAALTKANTKMAEQERLTKLFGSDDSDSSDGSDVDLATLKRPTKEASTNIKDLSDSSDDSDDDAPAPTRRIVQRKGGKKTTSRNLASKGKGKAKAKASATKKKSATKRDITKKRSAGSSSNDTGKKSRRREDDGEGGGGGGGFIASDEDNPDIQAGYDEQRVYESEDDPMGDDVAEEEEEDKKNDFERALERVSRRGRKKKEALSTEEQREFGIDFVERMQIAADADQRALRGKKPAFKKLQMLDSVVKTLSDITLHTMFLEDTNVLAAIRDWMQPMKATKALPNIAVRTAMLRVLEHFQMDLHRMRRGNNRIAAFVNFMRNHKGETQENRKSFQILYEKWARLVVDKTDNFRKLEELQAHNAYHEQGSKEAASRTAAAVQRAQRLVDSSAKRGLNSLGADEEDDPSKPKRRERATPPTPMVFNFKHRPERPQQQQGGFDERRGGGAGGGGGGRGAGGGEQPDSYQSKLEKRMAILRKPVHKNQRAVKMSVEGRG